MLEGRRRGHQREHLACRCGKTRSELRSITAAEGAADDDQEGRGLDQRADVAALQHLPDEDRRNAQGDADEV